jgi:hypothetical protein
VQVERVLPNDAVNSFNTFITIGTAIFAGLSAIINGITNWRKSSLEYAVQKMQHETAQMQQEMQRREIEKLRLELQLEKGTKKKKSPIKKR